VLSAAKTEFGGYLGQIHARACEHCGASVAVCGSEPAVLANKWVLHALYMRSATQHSVEFAVLAKSVVDKEGL
jgi:hypothetical protein